MITFSSRIQNLIDTSGKDAALQRAIEIKQRVNALEAQLNPAKNVETSVEAKFANVLKDSSNENVKFRLTNQSRFDALTKMPEISQLAAIKAAKNNETIDSIKAVQNVQNNSKSQIREMISQIAQKHGVDEKLVNAVIKQESGFNPNATSHCGAMGLMQLMPATAKGLGVKDAYNPMQNVDGGVRYLKSMLDKYNGNVVLALAAYNAGSGAVDKYKDVPPYKETQNYVKSILANYLN